MRIVVGLSLTALIVGAGLAGCQNDSATTQPRAEGPASQPALVSDGEPQTKRAATREGFAKAPDPGEGEAVATFAGGCFWCMESEFEKIDGVKEAVSGYMGGHVERPTYEQVSARTTGHAEVIQVLYEPAKVSYAELLEHFWRNIDPVADNRQFCDVGDEYRAEIFFHDAQQKEAALASLEEVKAYAKKSGTFDPARVTTRISPAEVFYPAETYHQDFYKKNPARYTSYRTGCGRDRRLKELWGE